MTPRRWINNLMEVANEIADQRAQESRWLAPDAKPWEDPGELINTVDDYVLDGFIEAFDPIFSEEQRTAILQFHEAFENFCAVPRRSWEPSDVLADSGWDVLRRCAFDFVRAFVGVWPGPESRIRADDLLEQYMQAYAARNKQAAESISKAKEVE